MGWDISYHPISETQMKDWYFSPLSDRNVAQSLLDKYKFEPFYQQKYLDTLNVALNIKPDSIFDKTHGFCIAIVQGFFETFFYTRGSALSFSQNSLFERYAKPWQEFVATEELSQSVYNRVAENYCSGYFIPYNGVVQLLNDYQQNEEIKAELKHIFSEGRLAVLLKALNYAKEKGVGILEASEVIMPNPFDINKSNCYSNLYHCDLDGVILYQKSALKQIDEIGRDKTPKQPEISVKTQKEIQKKKKSFLQRFFGMFK